MTAKLASDGNGKIRGPHPERYQRRRLGEVAPSTDRYLAMAEATLAVTQLHLLVAQWAPLANGLNADIEASN